MQNQEQEIKGTGIFRKILNPNGIFKDNWYITEELSFKDKEYIDKLNAKMMNIEWDVDETTCMQELSL